MRYYHSRLNLMKHRIFLSACVYCVLRVIDRTLCVYFFCICRKESEFSIGVRCIYTYMCRAVCLTIFVIFICVVFILCVCSSIHSNEPTLKFVQKLRFFFYHEALIKAPDRMNSFLLFIYFHIILLTFRSQFPFNQLTIYK